MIEPLYQLQKQITPFPKFLKETELMSMYVSWVNNFLTVEKFAEYYDLDNESALFIIKKGKQLQTSKEYASFSCGVCKKNICRRQASN